MRRSFDRFLAFNSYTKSLEWKCTNGTFPSLNEGNPNEPDWQKVFYGKSYQRLLEIKNRYDPDRVFYGRTAVGSEALVERKDGRLCRKETY